MSTLTTTWGLIVGVFLLCLNLYGTRPGDAGTPAVHWPGESRIAFDAARPNLLLFLDPDCPCGRASLAELGRIAARCAGKAEARVVVLGPEGEAGTGAGSIPGVSVVRDRDGAEARRFGARTSGQVLLFDPDGRLRFSGGITPSRGHEGDSYGRDAVLALIADPDAAARHASPVFGCPLTPMGDTPGSEAGR